MCHTEKTGTGSEPGTLYLYSRSRSGQRCDGGTGGLRFQGTGSASQGNIYMAHNPSETGTGRGGLQDQVTGSDPRINK